MQLLFLDKLISIRGRHNYYILWYLPLDITMPCSEVQLLCFKQWSIFTPKMRHLEAEKRWPVLALDQALWDRQSWDQECDSELNIFNLPCHPLVLNMLLRQHWVLPHIGVVFQIFVEGWPLVSVSCNPQAWPGFAQLGGTALSGCTLQGQKTNSQQTQAWGLKLTRLGQPRPLNIFDSWTSRWTKSEYVGCGRV